MRRVVITGLGIISSIGSDINDFWNNCLNGISNVSKIPEHWFDYANFTSKIWAPLPEINFEQFNLTRIEQKKMDKASMLALSACSQAVKSANFKIGNTNDKNNSIILSDIDSTRGGVFIGTGIGGVSTLGECFANQILNKQIDEINKLLNDEKSSHSTDNKKLKEIINKMIYPKRFNPFAVSMIMSNACAANIAVRYNINGINNTYSSACASGTIAIGNAFNSIRNNNLDCAIAGGTEYFYDEYGALFYSFDILKTLVKNCDDIEKANRPFDKDRSGFLYSRGGAAVLILEELNHALHRGADIIAEIKGFAETCDAHNLMMIDENCININRMLDMVLKDAGLKPGDIDYINTHGTGTELNDEIEAKIIDDKFKNNPLVNSTKSILGHTLGASGAIEAIVSALSIRDKKVHVSKNIFNPVRELNFAIQTKEHDVKNVLTESFGFGGHNAGLIISEYK